MWLLKNVLGNTSRGAVTVCMPVRRKNVFSTPVCFLIGYKGTLFLAIEQTIA